MRAVLRGLLLVAMTAGGQAGVQAQVPKSAPLAQRAAPGMEVDTNRFGSDYRGFDAGNAQACQAACAGEAACRAWTWVKPGIQGPAGKCWLKNQVPPATANACCVSGLGRPPASAQLRPQPQPPALKGNVGTAKVTAPVRRENPRAKADQQVFANSVRQQNALAAATHKALLTESGAESLVKQGIIKPEVYTINKQRPAGYVFRPGAAFTIQGRGLGTSGVLRLVGLFRNPVPIVLTDWRPNAILAGIGPDITGEIDVGPVRLEILPLGAAEPVIVPNLRFEAAREVALLRNIPDRYVKFMGWPAKYTTNGQGQASADYSEFLKSSKLQSAIVTRENRGKQWFAPGTDTFALGLNALFKISSVDFQYGTTRTNASECKGVAGGEYFQGRYAFDIVSDNTVKVDWGVWRCHSSPKWAGFSMLPEDNLNGSAYALDVYVIGPRGADPWIR